jgi:hypothetical protein
MSKKDVRLDISRMAMRNAYLMILDIATVDLIKVSKKYVWLESSRMAVRNAYLMILDIATVDLIMPSKFSEPRTGG